MVTHSSFCDFKINLIQPSQLLLSAKGAIGAGGEVMLGVWEPQERHLYTRINFKLNRAAALAEWRQVLSG